MNKTGEYVSLIVFVLSFVIITIILWIVFFNKKIFLNDYLIYGLDFKDENKINDIISSASTEEEISELDSYKFSVSSVSKLSFDYSLVLNDVGLCTQDLVLERSNLKYALYLEDDLINMGSLSDIERNNLYTTSISKGNVHNYSFKVWIPADDNSGFADRYYCYNILLEV